MDGLFFVLSIVAIGLMMFWLVQNDRIAADQPTIGLFAMPDTAGLPPRGKRRVESLLPAAEPAATKPSTTKPSMTNPGTTKPGTTKPGAGPLSAMSAMPAKPPGAAGGRWPSS